MVDDSNEPSFVYRRILFFLVVRMSLLPRREVAECDPPNIDLYEHHLAVLSWWESENMIPEWGTQQVKFLGQDALDVIDVCSIDFLVGRFDTELHQ